MADKEKAEKDKVAVKVRITDMNEELLKDSTNSILDSFKKFTNEREIAYHIKRDMDKKYLPSWHCVIGRNFGSYVTHDEGQYLQADKGQSTVLLWK